MIRPCVTFFLKALVALVAVAVALLLTGQAVEPRQLPGLVLINYAPFPAYLLPVLVAVLASCALGWPWRALAVLCLGVTLTVVMGLAWGKPDEGHGRVRFMTYNVKAYLASKTSDGFTKLAQEINEHQPDILVLQDAQTLSSGEGERDPLSEVISQQREVYQSGQYVVASRWPLSDCRVAGIPIGGHPHGFVHCVVTVHGARLNVVTAHFLSPRDGLNAARKEGMEGMGDWQQNMLARLQQTGLLAEHLRQMSGPILLGGDLNAPEASAVVQTLLNTGLRDAFSSAGRGYGYTYGHALLRGLSFLRIDHILVSHDIGVVQAFPGGSEASEHRALIADLVVHRQP
jgi:endonuclease/exonuclease/phosphatase (EEP) superfamily protein YafD